MYCQYPFQTFSIRKTGISWIAGIPHQKCRGKTQNEKKTLTKTTVCARKNIPLTKYGIKLLLIKLKIKK